MSKLYPGRANSEEAHAQLDACWTRDGRALPNPLATTVRHLIFWLTELEERLSALEAAAPGAPAPDS